jgi:hypothetical protein
MRITPGPPPWQPTCSRTAWRKPDPGHPAAGGVAGSPRCAHATAVERHDNVSGNDTNCQWSRIGYLKPHHSSFLGAAKEPPEHVRIRRRPPHARSPRVLQRGRLPERTHCAAQRALEEIRSRIGTAASRGAVVIEFEQGGSRALDSRMPDKPLAALA